MNKRFKRLAEIANRLRAIANQMETENRAMTEDEQREVAALEREQDILSMQIRSEQSPVVAEKKPTLKEVFRSLDKVGARARLYFRDGEAAEPTVNLTGDAEKGGIIPLTVGDFVRPLREELIYNKVGIQLPVGLRGKYEWPVVEALKATVAGESVKIGGQKINLSKVAAVTQRVGIVVEASRESLYQSDGKLESIIREQMPLAIADLINTILVSPEKVTDDCAIAGPLVGKTAKAIDFTFKGFNKEKAALLAKGNTSRRMCFIMTEATKAELEATPKDAGSGIMVIENDKLCGLPVFCHEAVGDGNVALGDFTYQVAGQFGDLYFTYDPYTEADANVVRFVINVDFGTATLRPESFVLLKAKA
jgi:HK97 family phage major capsid protein